MADHDISSVNDSDSDSDSGVGPYRFEPLAQNNEEPAEGPVIEHDIQRLQNTEWCTCYNCVAMPTVTESICCQEIEKIEAKGAEVGVQCIIGHEGFDPVCTNKWVLQTAYFGYKQAHGHYEEEDSHKRYRYTAYRQFVRWCFGFLGKKIRVPIPSCVVNRIHEEFPSITYEGFHEHPDLPVLNYD